MIILKDPAAGAKPFQYGLRTLFVGIALLGIVLAIMIRLDPLWSLALGWALLLILAHVAGNVWGTRSGMQLSMRAAREEAPLAETTRPIAFAPATRLRVSSRLSKSMQLAALLGATIGSIAGTLTIMILYQAKIGYLGTSIASISGAALGAMLGFLASSFIGIAGRAFREAAHDPAPSVPR